MRRSNACAGSSGATRWLTSRTTELTGARPDLLLAELEDDVAQGQTWDYANKMALGSMVPQPGLSSTGQALAGGGQVLAFRQGSSGSVTLNLTTIPGPLSVEWLNVNTGAVTAGAQITGGASRTLTPSPAISGPAVVYLRNPVPVELMGVTVE